jgi:rhodanese-related sulfurtransferase
METTATTPTTPTTPTTIEITLENLAELEPGSYQLIDIRSEQEIAYGQLDGALRIDSESLLAVPPENHGQKLVIC